MSLIGGGGSGRFVGIGPTIEKMRHDNNLLDEVHDPEEDEPHIVGIPHRYEDAGTTDSVSPTVDPGEPSKE